MRFLPNEEESREKKPFEQKKAIQQLSDNVLITWHTSTYGLIVNLCTQAFTRASLVANCALRIDLTKKKKEKTHFTQKNRRKKYVFFFVHYLRIWFRCLRFKINWNWFGQMRRQTTTASEVYACDVRLTGSVCRHLMFVWTHLMAIFHRFVLPMHCFFFLFHSFCGFSFFPFFPAWFSSMRPKNRTISVVDVVFFFFFFRVRIPVIHLEVSGWRHRRMRKQTEPTKKNHKM